MNTYIFDFDGTLVDSMEAFAGAMVNILKENNIKYPPDIIKTVTPLGYRESAKYFAKEFKVNMSEEEMVNMMKQFAYKQYSENIKTKETVTDTLKALKARGDSLNVLTASPHIVLDVCLKHNGIYDLFDNIWSCDDFNTTKADVSIYKAVAERLHKEVRECTFADDNINACKTSKKAGMITVGVYDKSSDEYKEQMKSICDKYIFKFSELL